MYSLENQAPLRLANSLWMKDVRACPRGLDRNWVEALTGLADLDPVPVVPPAMKADLG